MKVIAVEDEKPFVLVIPDQTDKVTLFDGNGKEIKIHLIVKNE